MRPNPGKSLSKTVDKNTYVRYPIKTHLITINDLLDDVIQKYVASMIRKGDILIVSERIVAVTQGRSFLINEINPSWWARFLPRFVSKHPGGIGLKSPHTMELAIKEVGLLKILLAAAVAFATKPFGIKGLFYQVVGANINAIDGPCDYTLPPGNKSAKLGPKNPMKVAKHISRLIKTSVAIIDANDYGVRVMGYSLGIDKRLIETIFSDNPLGQADEQTPLAVVRRLS